MIARQSSRRRLDLSGLLLMTVGLVFGAISYCLITFGTTNVLVIVPSVVAVTVGAMHLIKREAPRA
ncbi:hypothetical protein CNO18_09735 [Gordonia sp. 1D]|nr:hypothetical protein CNO18_09735 [Gordonia sp. 1D]